MIVPELMLVRMEPSSRVKALWGTWTSFILILGLDPETRRERKRTTNDLLLWDQTSILSYYAYHDIIVWCSNERRRTWFTHARFEEQNDSHQTNAGWSLNRAWTPLRYLRVNGQQSEGFFHLRWQTVKDFGANRFLATQLLALLSSAPQVFLIGGGFWVYLSKNETTAGDLWKCRPWSTAPMKYLTASFYKTWKVYVDVPGQSFYFIFT